MTAMILSSHGLVDDLDTCELLELVGVTGPELAERFMLAGGCCC